MIVCICNAVTEKEIREAVQKGAGSLSSMQNNMDVCNQCCQCECKAKAIILDENQKQLRSKSNLDLAYAV